MIDSSKYKRCGERAGRSDGSCGKVLFLRDFAKNKRLPGGRERYCRECVKSGRIKKRSYKKKVTQKDHIADAPPLSSAHLLAARLKWG